MESFEVFDADDLVELVERLLEGLWCANVVTGSEDVAGVNADAYAGFVFYFGDCIADVLEG